MLGGVVIFVTHRMRSRQISEENILGSNWSKIVCTKPSDWAFAFYSSMLLLLQMRLHCISIRN